jgi:hypothetical protein
MGSHVGAGLPGVALGIHALREARGRVGARTAVPVVPDG